MDSYSAFFKSLFQIFRQTKNFFFNKKIEMNSFFITHPDEKINHRFENTTDEESLCPRLKYISAYLLVLYITGVTFNLLLLRIFWANKDTRIPINVFVIALTIINFIGVLLEIPLLIISNFYCK